ncbi:DUF3899 domain-containing protein [Liquorilactobacillus cacaonum]|nr:DUF3899 domain-containing protein [Liquorilactobacillus cacaonum]
MNQFKKKYYFKSVSVIQILGLLIAIMALIGIDKVLVSNILFMIGLGTICLAVVDILLGAHLLAGWFRHKKKGETDDEYEQSKIKIREVGRMKNQPVRFSRFGRSMLIIGASYIILAIVITL